ncbi:haptoglobin-like [Mobula birostris]|uniref:haptoglobin-like n=1 Tax=Mobula birostris TaxID=1983395 RepID=UPI003B283FE4
MWFLVLNFVAVFSLVASDHHIDCGQPGKVDHADVRYLTREGQTTVGAVIQYECKKPLWVLENADNGVYICAETGNWTNRKLKTELPQCKKVIDCGPPKGIEHGHVDHLTDHLENDYLSIVKYTCHSDYREEVYSDEGLYVCTETGHWMNKDLGEKLPKCIPVHCGEAITLLHSEKETDHTELVTHGAAPWTVLLERVSNPGDLRNAVLIDHRWALTSVHNFGTEDEKEAAGVFTVHVGVEDATDLRTGRRYRVERVDFQSAVSKEGEAYRNDIALLKLAEPVAFGDHAIPICLPSVDYATVGRLGVVAGWDLDHKGGAHHVTYATLPVAPRDACAQHFVDQHPGLFPADMREQFCTHAVEQRPDAAQRDQGAVFQVEVNGTNYAAGVLSYDDPGEDHNHAVFTNAFDHINWIKGVIRVH